MAYIPDEAVDQMTKLTAGAWRLYCFLARCRNQRSGKCCPSVSLTMESIGINRGTVYALRKELQSKSWAIFDGDSASNLFGFTSLKNQTISPESEKSDSLKNQTTAVEPEEVTEEVGDSLKNQTFSPESEKSDFLSEKSDLLYKEEPAKEPAKKNMSDASASPEADVTSKAKKPKQTRATAVPPGAIGEVFTYWQDRLNHLTAKLTDGRKRKIQARLNENYTVEQLKQAIDGCASSPFHMGQNDRNTVYDDIELICRDGGKVEGFIAKIQSKPNTGARPATNEPTAADYALPSTHPLPNKPRTNTANISLANYRPTPRREIQQVDDSIPF